MFNQFKCSEYQQMHCRFEHCNGAKLDEEKTTLRINYADSLYAREANNGFLKRLRLRNDDHQTISVQTFWASHGENIEISFDP